MLIQRHAELEDICSICDIHDLSMFKYQTLTFYDKNDDKYILNTVTLEITKDGKRIDVVDLPVIYTTVFEPMDNIDDMYFIGNGDILGSFGSPYPKNMCGYLSLSIHSKKVFLLSSGLDNIYVSYPTRLYYMDIFSNSRN